MEPQIQYAKTSDGVNIAYWTLGVGTPLIYMPPALPASDIETEWQIAECRHWYQAMAQSRTLVRFDSRGAGLSDRTVSSWRVDALVFDLQAVVDELPYEKINLYAAGHAGPVAIAYASQFPDKTEHLVLWCTYARATDTFSARGSTLRQLSRLHWDIFSEAMAGSLLGLSAGEPLARFASLLSKSVSEEALQIANLDMETYDVSSMLPMVRSPTLVLHRRNAPLIPLESSRYLASNIVNSRLSILEGDSIVPWLGDSESALQAIHGFLSDDTQRTTILPSGTAIILFADIVDSTALTERLGDDAFRAKARHLDTVLRAIIRDNAGTLIEGKLLGDGVLATFTSARQAIEAALACGRAGDQGELPLHLGLHAGDVIREENNVYGGAVNIASRISGLSAPGEVLVSRTVADLARTSAGVTFEDRGEQSLKGVAEPVRVWRVSPVTPADRGGK